MRLPGLLRGLGAVAVADHRFGGCAASFALKALLIELEVFFFNSGLENSFTQQLGFLALVVVYFSVILLSLIFHSEEIVRFRKLGLFLIFGFL